MKALVIDDDPQVLLLLQNVFRQKGCEVLSYQTPADCPLHLCPTCPCCLPSPCPDMILSDYDMPIVNGIQFLERLFSKGCKCRHIAMMSASGITEQNLVRISKWGVRFFLKPFDLDQLENWIDRIKSESI